MSDIDMNDYDTFDENIGALKSNLSSKDKLDYYFSRLNERINGEASVSKIRNEVYNFIYVNTLMDADVKKHLIELVDGNYTDGLKLSSDILSYLRNSYDNAEYVFETDDKKMDEVKEDFIERIDDKLDVSNIEVEGRYQDIKDALNSRDDLDKLNNEVDLAKEVSSDENNRVYLTTDDLVEAIQSPEEGVLKDKVEDQIKNQNTSGVEVTEDGTVEINGNLQDPDSQNYMAMMLMGLTVSDMNLDMYLSKDKKGTDDYKVTFGNFPAKNHPENALTATEINKINEISDSYQTTTDYQKYLSNANPAIGTLNDIVFDQLDRDGTMKVGISNRNGNYNIGLNMSSEHQSLADALNANGAVVSMDINENSVARIDGDNLEQYNVLNNTQQTLANQNEQVNEMTNNYQYVKKMDIPNNEAAKVSPYFLIVVGITEVLLLASYFVFFLIRK